MGEWSSNHSSLEVVAAKFLATGCRNYATESVNLTANLKADFPKHISYIATHNRTVNISGIAGRGKPIDQLIEHYNL